MTMQVFPFQGSERRIGLVNIAVHGHFYQPLREDPFTGIIPEEEGAAPYANFNERITAECYRPNAKAGNFEVMSFNVGPTLASWLEKAHPDVHQYMVEADHLYHNALAQVYHHTILPLANARDKRTQVLWGVQDFRHRFGHKPCGMWLAETAVDLETLDIMAECGIQFTILSPWQAAREVDMTEPYLVRLREGRSMTVFFYNPLSGSVSYSDEATVDANRFAASYQQHYLNREKAAAGIAQMTVIATDGELYGHHKTFREKFLSHFLRRSAKAYGLEFCSLERYLDASPATREAEIHERSSWSCCHGIHRWDVGCDCDGTGSLSQREWKAPFRQALEYLQESGDALFEKCAGEVLHDLWEARNDYIALRNGWEIPERFWTRHARSSRSDIECIRQAQDLLEAQYYLQAAFTSCGFFFEDLDRIEPRNNIAFARRAISLLWQATGHDVQKDFLKDLQKAKSWRTGRTGADLYHSLPNVPKNLLPPQLGTSTERERT
jgi:hypothetical protein